MANLPVLTACLDNAVGQLNAGIAANTTSIPLQSGNGALFPQPQNGTCTSAGTASTLNSTSIGALVSVGQPIRNVTDGSWAFILTVSTNSVTTTALQGGSANTWANTNVWRVNEMVVTLENRDAGGNVLKREKALVSGRTTDTLVCASAADRGFDGSTASTFSANDYLVLDVVSYTIRKIIEQCSEFGRLIDANLTSIANLNAGSPFYGAATGSSNAYAVTLSPAPAAYAASNVVVMKANFTNTGAATLNVNGLGAKAIKRKDGATDLASGDVHSGQVVILVYDGTNFQMQSPAGGTSGPEVAVFGDGSDGALSVTSGTTTVDLLGANYVVKRYASINVATGATLAFTNPAADGTVIVLKSQGNVTIAGTVNASGMGASGAAAAVVVRTSGGPGGTLGNAGTNPFNSLGQSRTGGEGQISNTNGDASGGASGSSTTTPGIASAVAGGAAAATAGSGVVTAALVAVAQTGITVSPGTGGSSGGASLNISTYTSGTWTVTSGAGGNGGGALEIYCGGNYTDAGGTINLSGSAGGAGTSSAGVGTANTAAGGGAGGASGCGAAYVKGTITQSGTKTLTGGSGGAAVTSGSGAGSAGAAGAAGTFLVVPISLGY